MTDIESVDPEETVEDPEPFDYRAAFLDWVTAHFATVEVVGTKEIPPWCAKWWKHPEAVARLWALYKAHTQAFDLSENLDAESDWWLNHWDRHRAILLDGENGPFRDCDPTLGHLSSRRRNKGQPVLAVSLPPDEWQPPVS